MKMMCDVTETFLNARQKEDESVNDCTNRFKFHKKSMKFTLKGPLMILKIIEEDSDFDENDQSNFEEVTSRQFDRFAAYCVIENADREKHESFINELKSQRALGNDQFSKKYKEAVKVLSDSKTDQSYFDKKKKKKQEANKVNNDFSNRSEEREDENKIMTFANTKGSCHCCEKKGHLSTSCRQRDTLSREQWAIDKASLTSNLHVSQDTSSSQSFKPKPSLMQLSDQESVKFEMTESKA